MEVKSKAQRSFSRGLFKAKHAVLNVVTRDNPPNLTNKDFTIEDWGRKISHQQEEGKEFQKQLQKYINALRTLTFERSRLLDLLLCGYPSAWGQKDKLKLSKIEQEAAVENCASKLNYDTMSKLNKYALMFPDYRAKINRLDRRRIDLDLQKENYEKVKNSKNLNAQKVQRAKLLVDEEQQIYDDMTNQLREELPQVYSSRAGLIGYIFASWMREEIDLHKEITRHNEKIESVMLQLQQDHQTGKLRSNSAQNSRQNSRENRESEVDFLRADKKYRDEIKRGSRSQSSKEQSSPSTPLRSSSTPNAMAGLGVYDDEGASLASEPQRRTDLPDNASATSFHDQTRRLSSHSVTPLVHEKLSDQMGCDPSIVKMPSKKSRDHQREYKSNSAERDNIDTRYQMATIQQGGLPRLSSRHDEEEAEFNQRMADAPTMPAKATEAPPMPPSVDDEVVSDDSLAPDENDEEHNHFPPPPEEAAVVATAEEAVVRQEPSPEKATIERSRSPSPVKMAETSSNPPARPPSYDEVVSDEIEPPPAYEYTVKAIYPYKQADEDELSFAKGEMILVVKHPHPEEQDEGWLLGIREKEWRLSNDLKKHWGLFPANFTKKLQ